MLHQVLLGEIHLDLMLHRDLQFRSGGDGEAVTGAARSLTLDAGVVALVGEVEVCIDAGSVRRTIVQVAGAIP